MDLVKEMLDFSLYGSADGNIFNNKDVEMELIGIIDDVLDSIFHTSAYPKINIVLLMKQKRICKLNIRALSVLDIFDYEVSAMNLFKKACIKACKEMKR
eukprot:snap_masked-scaffold_14-processed-gene-0.35-mRNA-1 protein AED:1.00 eAED:1.00 QI:0/-1/0/0/-1/1/1/0/98